MVRGLTRKSRTISLRESIIKCNMRNWINQKYGTNFTEENLVNVKDFALIWNVFESVVCSTHFSIGTVEQEIQNKIYNIADFQSFLEYFKNRYVVNGGFNNRFQHLNFRNGDRQTLVEGILLGNNTKEKDVILALLIIVYRFRNNLFHGVKDIQVIEEQSENFENANAILKLVLDKF